MEDTHGEKITLFCKFNGTIAIVDLYQNYTFTQLVNEIVGNWNLLAGKSLSVFYLFDGRERIMLQNDAHLKRLFALAVEANIKRVDVCVEISDSFVGVTNCDERIDSVGANEVNINVPNALSTYCSHQEKTLLSLRWKGLIKEVGQIFLGGARQFRTDLSKFSIELGFHYVLERNDSSRVTANCFFREEKKCMWRVHARSNKINGYFYIRELNNVHTCGATVRTLQNKRMSSDIIASEIIDDVRTNPLVSPTHIQMKMKDSYGLNVTYNHVWLGVEKAKNHLFGDHTLSYEYLIWYMEITNQTNPGSKLEMQYDCKSGRFKRFFVSFDACIHGFNFCRPLLFLDGTFLKGEYKGNLLAATGKDGNGGLFHLAFAIVDSEDEDNWRWFLEQLTTVVDPNRVLTFVSDRNKGLLEAVPSVFPTSYHAFCLRHLKANIRDKFQGRLKEFKEKMVSKLNVCAYTPTVDSCLKNLAILKAEGKGCVDKFLEYAPIQHWTNAFFKGKRYGEMTSNAAESFNAWIRVARSLPVMNLVDTIREQLMVDFTKCRKLGAKMKTDICPEFDNKLQESLESGRTWVVNEASDHVYEVKSIPSVLVNIQDRTCGCFKWQLNGFPCEHAIAAIHSCNKDLASFVEDYFHSDYYRYTYSKSIFPIPTLGKPAICVEDIVVHPPLS